MVNLTKWRRSSRWQPPWRRAWYRCARTWQSFTDDLSRRNSVIAILVLLTCLAAADGVLAQAVDASARTAETANIQIRVAWGGGAPQAWRAQLQLSEGTFQSCRSLGTRPNGRSIEAHGAELRVASAKPATYEALDVGVTAPLDARLLIRISNPQNDAQPYQTQLTIQQLIDETHNAEIDDLGNRLLLQRSPGDRIRVQFAQDHLVFAPGDNWTIDVVPNLPGESREGLRLTLEIVDRQARRILHRDQSSITMGESGQPVALRNLAIPIPTKEGVYELQLKLNNRRTATFFREAAIQRAVQFVVVDRQRLNSQDGDEWQQILEFDAAQPRWWESLTRLPGWERLSITAKRRVGEGQALAWQLADQIVSRLEPGQWQVYPLPGAKPGQPHLLEVTCPGMQQQSLAVSVVEPELGAGGHLTGVAVENLPLAQSQDETVRLIFWPRTRVPYVMLRNLSDERPALFSKIALARTPTRLPSMNRQAATFGFRQALAYYPIPAFPTLFSADRAVDPASRRELTDWSTFLQGSNRLVDYLKHAGYTGATVGALVDGTGIFPSSEVEASARFDTGAYFSNGQDAVPKDILELLFRVFDREQMQLVPLVRFSAPLRSLAQTPPPGDGLSLVDVGGNPYSLTGTEVQWTCNPLDPRVQQAMRRLIRELVSRYAHHKSFGGVCIEMGPDTYTHLPGAEWGYDEATLARFLEQQSVDKRPPTREALIAELKDGALGPNWFAWRAKQITELHRLLALEVRRLRPDARMYLASSRLIDTRTLGAVYRPTLGPRPSLSSALNEMGIDLAGLQSIEGLELTRPYLDAPSSPLTRQGAALELAASSEFSDLLRQQDMRATHSGVRARRIQWPNIEAATEDAPQVFSGTVASLALGAERRARLMAAIVGQDAHVFLDGAVARATTMSPDMQQQLDVFQHLPSEPFAEVEASPGQPNPVVVRQLSRGQRTTIYAVNNGPWPQEVILRLDAPADCRARPIGGSGAPVDWRQVAGGFEWNMKLKPFTIEAAEFNRARVQVMDVVSKTQPQAAAQIQSQLTELIFRVGQLNGPSPYGRLRNAGFEQSSDDVTAPLDDWESPLPQGTSVVADTSQRRTGAQSMRIESQGPITWVRSAAFPPPETGRLSVQVWLKIAQGEAVPPLRLAIEGKLNNQPYYRFANISPETITGDWVQFLLHVDDLPSHDLEQLQVRFDLMGPGRVWVDDITLFDMSFTRSEQLELSKIVALADLQFREGRLADCAQTLTRYWPRFLLEQMPAQSELARRSDSDAPRRTDPPAQDEEPSQESPTTLDRLRKLVPKF